MSKEFVDWIIHYVANGAKCDECGKVEDEFFYYSCDAHTHGLSNYNHQEFQLVLDMGMEEAMRILNTLGLRVKAGERFKAGDYVKGIYDDCDVRLDEFKHGDEMRLRVIIPDKNMYFPEDERCSDAYLLQLLETEDLLIPTDKEIPTIKLYQMRNDNDNRNYVFESLESLQKQTGGRVPAELYDLVYEGQLDAKNPEEVFTIFNTVYTEGYKGRSMSVSDVVEFKYSDTKDFFFYCDSFGFKLIHFNSKSEAEGGGCYA